MTVRSAATRANIRTLSIYFIGYRLFCAGVLLACAYLTPFDSSHRALEPLVVSETIFGRFISTALRWDTFHFLEIARSGYTYEHQYAFFPGAPIILRATSSLLGYGTTFGMLWGTWLSIIYCLTIPTLYDLTLLQTGSQELTMLASACTIITTSPPTFLHAPYAEPFFAFLSFKGMLYCSRKQWIQATLMFMLASCFRSNGILLSGYLLWGLILEPLSSTRFVSYAAIFKAAGLSCLVALPVLAHQLAGYMQFCMVSDAPEWCHARLPFIYSHVQSKYWDVGLFRYWTIAQVPNFALAAPPLALLLWASWTHMRRYGFDTIVGIWTRPERKEESHESRLTAAQITPHAVHAFLLSLIFIFASHTQIVLRLASSLPFTHWAAARLWVEKPALAKWWTGYTVVWSIVSLVTWGLFLPPA